MKSTIFLVLTAVVLSGCINRQTTQSESPTEPGREETRLTDSAPPAELEEMANAIEAGESVSCTMSNDTDSTMVYHIKGEKFKITGMSTGEDLQTGSMLSDGEFIYNWSDDTKMGTKMKIEEPEEVTSDPEMTEELVDEESQISDPRDFYDQGFEVDCERSIIADSEFVIPTDVTFTDLSDLMQNMGQPEFETP